VQSRSEEALAWLAAMITSPTLAAGVSELALRYSGSQPAARELSDIRHRSATTMKLDRQASGRFLSPAAALTEVGPLFGRCPGWASAICSRGTIGYYAADELASELGLYVDEFLAQVCAPEELERLSA